MYAGDVGLFVCSKNAQLWQDIRFNFVCLFDLSDFALEDA